LKSQGSKVNMRPLLKELRERDKKDIERKNSPLMPAEDSYLIDTTNIDPQEVIEEIKSLSFNFLNK